MENSAKQRVFIIEDEAAILKILSMALGKTYEVTSFTNGMDALAFMQQGNIPDIILSDLNTPQLNGYDLLTQLKASSFFHSIPFVILSGEFSTDVRVKCLEAGADDYILKPFNPREIDARVNIILKRYGKKR